MNDKVCNVIERIADYCDKIEAAKSRFFPDRVSFDEEGFYRDGCAFYVQQIGELVKELPESFTAENTEVPWYQIRGFRNVIAHAYDSVDADILWETITDDIPNLARFCRGVLGG